MKNYWAVPIVFGIAVMMLSFLPLVSATASTPCSGTLSAGTYGGVVVLSGDFCILNSDVIVERGVQVENGAHLVAISTSIGGNVKVGNNAILVAQSTFIDGNVQVKNGAGLSIYLTSISGYVKVDGIRSVFITSSTIGGNVDIEGMVFDMDIRTSTIEGNLKIEKNSGDVTVGRSTIEGNLKIEKNSGLLVRAIVNTVSGNLDFNDNTPIGNTPRAPIVGENNVGGNLNCDGNIPAPSTTPFAANTVDGHKKGQCVGL